MIWKVIIEDYEVYFTTREAAQCYYGLVKREFIKKGNYDLFLEIVDIQATKVYDDAGLAFLDTYC